MSEHDVSAVHNAGRRRPFRAGLPGRTVTCTERRLRRYLLPAGKRADALFSTPRSRDHLLPRRLWFFLALDA